MKVLVLTDKYFPKPYANALCAQELIREFNRRGCRVDVIAFQDSGIALPARYEGNSIYGVKPDLRLRLFYYADNFAGTKKAKISGQIANLISKAKGVFLLPWQPFFSFALPRRIHKLIEKLYVKQKYDAVISMLGPFDGTYGAYKFKKKHPRVPFAIYAVDTMDKTRLQRIFHTHFQHAVFWEKRFLETCDVYLPMESRIRYFQQKSFEPWKDKIVAVDLPRLTFRKKEDNKDYFHNQKENWVYAGSLGAMHYNPQEAIRFFLSLPEDKERVLHFYSRGDGVKYVQQAEEKYPEKIILHDYTDSDTLNRIMQSSDVLVSMKYSDQISAKIFECISYLKPIVHFSGTTKDPNAGYLAKYPNAFIVKTYEAGAMYTQKECLKKIAEAKENDLSKETIERIFEKSTPEFSVDMLIKHLGL